MKNGSYILHVYIVLWRFWFKKSKWLRYDFLNTRGQTNNFKRKRLD